MTLKEITDFSSRLEYRRLETFTLKIEPNTWMECYDETRKRNVDERRELLNDKIADEEKTLETQNIHKEYQPTKKMWSPKELIIPRGTSRRAAFSLLIYFL